MKKLNFIILLVFVCNIVYAQEYKKPVKPVKNVIVMIPDGTSIGVVSAARWYKTYNKLGNNLYIDPYICGTVKTHSSNAPIGDSAPTTSCYMTGVPQRTSNVSIYPVADPGKDIYPVDPAMAYQPLTTILEAAKYQLNKATGLVVTVEFPHATPADCAAHYYKRSKYKYIAPQMAYNNLDVMFGGGNKEITKDIKDHFKATNTLLLQDDINAFRAFEGKDKIWALFGKESHPFDFDRDDSKTPSLAEMTKKALTRLDQNENGFFLMVEGSKVDWAAHDNDAIGCITEYLAFDEAVGVALDFARKDGETAIIILPDHGNSGFTIGKRECKGYDKLSLADLFANVSMYKKTARGMDEILKKSKPGEFKSIFKKYTNIDLTDDELKELLSSKDYKDADNYMETSNSKNLHSTITQIMNSRTCFGFTTGGHTGEEVFLAAYHPNGDIPTGMNTNIEINQYLFDVTGLKTSLPDMTKEVYAKHQEVFKGLKYSFDKKSEFPVLTVTKGEKKLVIPAFKSIAYLNDEPFDLGSVVVYIDKNQTFYLPRKLVEMIK